MSTLTKYRLVLSAFMLGLILSGITAFPLAWELRLLTAWFGINPSLPPEHYNGLAFWLATVSRGLHETYPAYPWVAYGTDWLAFGHFVIAIAFVGALLNPVRNRWIFTFGLIACALVVPYALAFGAIRGIPFWWRLIDCSFGVFGMIPLWLCRKWVDELPAPRP